MGGTILKEQRIQYEIVMYLQSQGIYFFSVPNEAARKGNFQATGMRPGVSDLVVVLPGRVIFVEVKNEIGRQRPGQKIFQERVTALGHQYIVVRSVQDVVDILQAPV
jgi:hypothetical protein